MTGEHDEGLALGFLAASRKMQRGSLDDSQTVMKIRRGTFCCTSHLVSVVRGLQTFKHCGGSTARTSWHPRVRCRKAKFGHLANGDEDAWK